MLRVRRLAPIALCIALGVGGPLHGQRIHRGLWLGFGPGGVGVAGTEGFAYPVYLRVGGTINQRLLVGVEDFASIIDYDPPASAANITLVAVLYPARQGGLFAKSGVGLSVASANCPLSELDDTQTGFGATLGLGYDIQVRRNFYFTLGADLLLGTNERPLCPVPGQPGAGVIRDYRPAGFVTFGLTWH